MLILLAELPTPYYMGLLTLRNKQNLNNKMKKLNNKIAIGAVAAVILVIAGVILAKTYYFEPREDKASTALAKGQQYFAQDDFDTALNGDGKGYIGFINIANDYSGTDAANLANLYAGLSYAHKGNAKEAIKYLEDFSTGDDMMVSPAAIAALGNCYAEVGEVDKAISLLKKAAKKADNNSLSATFLIQAGELLESQGKKDDALDLYNQVKEKYTESMQYQEIDKYIERASK